MRERLRNFRDTFINEFHGEKLSEYISDLYSVWYVLALSVGSAFILGMLYMLLLRCCAGIITFFTLIGILILLAGGGAYVYFIGRE